MQFLKTLFWVLVAVLLAVFAIYNWRPVEIAVWRDIEMETWLPVPIITAFVLGVLLVWIPHRASVWRWRRKVDATERKLADEHAARNRAEEQLLDERNRASVVDPDPRFDDARVVEDTPPRDADGRLLDDGDRPL